MLTKHYDYGQAEMDYLISKDEALGAVINRLGKLERVITPDLFTALLQAIIGQLISVKAANTVWLRMVHQFGEVSPYNIASVSPDDIQNCGMTMKKAICIHTIAQLIVQGDFVIDELTNCSDAEVIAKLTKLNGIGQWTAEMLLIHSMERPDILSWGDIAIRRGIMKLYGLDSITKDQFEQYRLLYSPLGSIASIYLWEISSE
jgi:DNA-3-methyladenine glycosylase II